MEFINDAQRKEYSMLADKQVKFDKEMSAAGKLTSDAILEYLEAQIANAVGNGLITQAAAANVSLSLRDFDLESHVNRETAFRSCSMSVSLKHAEQYEYRGHMYDVTGAVSFYALGGSKIDTSSSGTDRTASNATIEISTIQYFLGFIIQTDTKAIEDIVDGVVESQNVELLNHAIRDVSSRQYAIQRACSEHASEKAAEAVVEKLSRLEENAVIRLNNSTTLRGWFYGSSETDGPLGVVDKVTKKQVVVYTKHGYLTLKKSELATPLFEIDAAS